MNQISKSKPTARKDHKCDWCELPILKDEKYERSTNEYEGNIYTWKNHITCALIADKLNMFDHCDEGLTGEDFQECIKDEYSQIMSDEHSDVYESPNFEIPSFYSRLWFVKNHYGIQ